MTVGADPVVYLDSNDDDFIVRTLAYQRAFDIEAKRRLAEIELLGKIVGASVSADLSKLLAVILRGMR